MEIIVIILAFIAIFLAGMTVEVSLNFKTINDLELENRKLKGIIYDENEANSELRYENDEFKELLTEVADRSVTCPLNSEKIVLNKIKELVRDYQSQN